MIPDTTTPIQITNWTPLSAFNELSNSTVVYAISGCYPSETYKDTVYVGSSKDFQRRCKNHFRDLTKGIHHNLFFQNAYNKHENELWVIGTLEVCNEAVLLEREQHYLDTLQPFIDCWGGFNICRVVGKAGKKQKGYKQTAEHIAKRVLRLKGQKRSPEIRAKMSIANSKAHRDKKREPFSDETRAKMSAAKKGRKLSDETKAKMSASHRGRKKSSRG